MSVSLPPRDEGLPQVPSVLPIRSRRARLEPVNTKTTELLYQASIHEEIPWQWRGRVESPEGFRESLWAGVLCQSVIVSSTSDEIGGLVQAYAANLSHGYCYIQLLLLPHARLKVWPLEGALLFVNRIFEKYGFRKLYIETAAHHFSQFSSVAGRLFEVEAVMREHLLVNGVPVDSITLAVTKDRWLARGRPMLHMVL